MVLSFFQLTIKVSVFTGKLLLGGVEIIESAVDLIQFGGGITELVLQLLRGLLSSNLFRVVKKYETETLSHTHTHTICKNNWTYI